MAQKIGNKSEYASHCGVTKAAVTKWVSKGIITTRKDGKINFAKADKERQQRAIKPSRNAKVTNGAASASNPNSKNSPDISNTPVNDSYMKARTMRESYNAHKAKAEYEKLIGQLLDKNSIKVAAYNAGKMTKDKLMELPNKLAPTLAAEQDETAVFEILKSEIHGILEELNKRLTSSTEQD